MSKYKVGDKVRIVSKPVKGNWVSSMDEYCGKVMTIEMISKENTLWGTSYIMEEDKKGWFWHDHMIDGLANTQEIHITVKGDETHAVLKENGKLVKRAVAKRHPDDEFDFETGAKIAFERLFKHEYKVGDYVEIIGVEKGHAHFLKKGSYAKIEKIDNGLFIVEGVKIKGNKKLQQSLLSNEFKPANITDAEYEAQFKTLYNGKVVCVDAKGFDGIYTKGKIYQFVDGVLIYDDGDKTPCVFSSFDSWNNASSGKWLEIVED